MTYVVAHATSFINGATSSNLRLQQWIDRQLLKMQHLWHFAVMLHLHTLLVLTVQREDIENKEKRE